MLVASPHFLGLVATCDLQELLHGSHLSRAGGRQPAVAQPKPGQGEPGRRDRPPQLRRGRRGSLQGVRVAKGLPGPAEPWLLVSLKLRPTSNPDPVPDPDPEPNTDPDTDPAPCGASSRSITPSVMLYRVSNKSLAGAGINQHMSILLSWHGTGHPKGKSHDTQTGRNMQHSKSAKRRCPEPLKQRSSMHIPCSCCHRRIWRSTLPRRLRMTATTRGPTRGMQRVPVVSTQQSSSSITRRRRTTSSTRRTRLQTASPQSSRRSHAPHLRQWYIPSALNRSPDPHRLVESDLRLWLKPHMGFGRGIARALVQLKTTLS